MATYSGSAAPTAAPEKDGTLAVKADGTLAAWGSAGSGLLSVPSLTGVIHVATGRGYGLALQDDGTVTGWGAPTTGNGQESVPVGLAGVVYLDGSYSHAAAVKSDGTVVAWGGSNGVIVPAGLNNVVMVACGTDVTWALKSDGTTAEWGDTNSPMPGGLSAIYQISGFARHCLALKSDGTVIGWGPNSVGELSIPVGLSDVVMVAAGRNVSLALKSDGTVVHWGKEDVYDGTGTISLVPPVGLSNVAAVYAGEDTGIAVKYDGSVVMWGSDSAGHSTPPAGLEVLIQDQIDLPEPIDGQINAALPFIFSGLAFQDWVAALPVATIQEIYTLTVTGSADGLDDTTIPISSWQATNQAAPRSVYVQAVIPEAGQYLQALQDRNNGDLVIRQGFKFSDGTTKTEEVVRVGFDTSRYDEGPTNVTMTVSGYRLGGPLKNGARTLMEIRSISLTNGKYRVRCKTDLFLQPGMTVNARGRAFRASYINYYANGSDRFSEVSDE